MGQLNKEAEKVRKTLRELVDRTNKRIKALEEYVYKLQNRVKTYIWYCPKCKRNTMVYGSDCQKHPEPIVALTLGVEEYRDDQPRTCTRCGNTYIKDYDWKKVP